MITVWGRENSTNVKKVLWCLEELGVSHHSIPAGGQYGLTQDPDYLAMNPNALVPCLRDEATDLTLWESNTIVRYLAAQYGEGVLWPSSPALRAQGEKWMDWSIATLAGPYRDVYISLIRTAPEQRDPAVIERGKQASEAAFAILDAALAKSRWLGGETFGPGDIALGPFIYGLFNLDIDWAPRPGLQRWYQQLCDRPAFRKIVMLPLS